MAMILDSLVIVVMIRVLYSLVIVAMILDSLVIVVMIRILYSGDDSR
jgi:hypothetical protein